MNCKKCILLCPDNKHCLLHGYNKKMPSCFPFLDQRGCFIPWPGSPAQDHFKEALLQAFRSCGWMPMGFLFAKDTLTQEVKNMVGSV